jgi:hypothetical protein
MPIPQSYYLNGADLASSTAVFLDPLMTLCAPDGFYSDGLIVREQVGCVLQLASSCESCGLLCSEATNIAGSEGLYLLNVNLGTDTGAVIVTFTPNDTPDGIKAEFDSVVYNALSSPLDGYHAAPTNLATYVGNTAFDCGLVAGSPYILTEYENSGISFVATGNTPTVNVTAPQVSTSIGNPLGCIMVIPKPNISPSNLLVQMYGICVGSSYNVSVSCPERLTSFYSTFNALVGETCGLDTDQIYYSVPVNGDGITLGLFDWVFQDYNGAFPLPDGYYSAPIHLPVPYDTYRMRDGIIVEFLTSCAEVDLDYSVDNLTTPCVSGGISLANLSVKWMPLNTTVIDTNANSSGTTTIQMGVYKIIFTVTYGSATSGCGYSSVMRLKLNGTTVVLTPDLNPVANATYQVTHTFSANGLTNYDIEATVVDGTPL